MMPRSPDPANFCADKQINGRSKPIALPLAHVHGVIKEGGGHAAICSKKFEPVSSPRMYISVLADSTCSQFFYCRTDIAILKDPEVQFVFVDLTLRMPFKISATASMYK